MVLICGELYVHEIPELWVSGRGRLLSSGSGLDGSAKAKPMIVEMRSQSTFSIQFGSLGGGPMGALC